MLFFSKIIIFQLPPELGLGLPNVTDPKIKKEPMENSYSPYHRYDISPLPQPPSPALSQTPYNITPNITQFATHSMIPQFIQSNQTSTQQFNNQTSFNVPQLVSPMKIINNNEPTSSTSYANANANNISEPALSLLLDMDNQQFFNSGDLQSISLSLLEGHFVSNTATEPLRADVLNQMEQDNMTDSFTRIAIQELNNLDAVSNNGNKF